MVWGGETRMPSVAGTCGVDFTAVGSTSFGDADIVSEGGVGRVFSTDWAAGFMRCCGSGFGTCGVVFFFRGAGLFKGGFSGTTDSLFSFFVTVV